MANMCGSNGWYARRHTYQSLVHIFCHGRTRDVEGERRREGEGRRWCLVAYRWPNDHCLCWFWVRVLRYTCLFVCLYVVLKWTCRQRVRGEWEWAKGLIACAVSVLHKHIQIQSSRGWARRLRKQWKMSVHRNGQLAQRAKRANKNRRRWMDVSFRCQQSNKANCL